MCQMDTYVVLRYLGGLYRGQFCDCVLLSAGIYTSEVWGYLFTLIKGIYSSKKGTPHSQILLSLMFHRLKDTRELGL